MRRPEVGDVVPFLVDDMRPPAIELLHVVTVEDASDYLEPSEEYILGGYVLRRVFHWGRDPIQIQDDDVWSSSEYAVWGSDVLPPIPLDYVEGYRWFENTTTEETA